MHLQRAPATLRGNGPGRPARLARPARARKARAAFPVGAAAFLACGLAIVAGLFLAPVAALLSAAAAGHRLPAAGLFTAGVAAGGVLGAVVRGRPGRHYARHALTRSPAPGADMPGRGDAPPASQASTCRRVAEETPVRVAILGPCAIAGTREDLQPKQAELLVALALAGEAGLTSETLRGMLGADEDHPKPADQLRQVITRTRRKLGIAPGGGGYISYTAGRHYVLHPAAVLDWHEFCHLAADGHGRGDPGPLRAALALLRGQPFEDLYYWWLDTAVLEEIRAGITGAARHLAALELQAGSPAAAARAARAGLAADPAAEQLWRALMRAEDAAGNSAGVHDTWRRCLAVITGIAADGQPHPDTAALYRELTCGHAPPARGPGRSLAGTGLPRTPRNGKLV